MPKRVTVCLAVYNGSPTLAKALECVRQQTYQDFDVLVLDDGSTDNSAAIAKQSGARVISVPNGGLGAARRIMVEEATGEYIAFVDHDDFWLPEKLEKQMNVIDSTGAALVHADGWYVYDDGHEVARDLQIANPECSWNHILPSNWIIASTAVFHRESMLKAGNFVDDTVRCSDWYGWLILAPEHKFVHMPEKLVRYSVLHTSLANAGLRFFTAQHYLISQKILPRRMELFANLSAKDRARFIRDLIRVDGVALSSMAKLHDQQREYKIARRLHRLAIRQAPTVPRVWTRAIRSYLK